MITRNNYRPPETGLDTLLRSMSGKTGLSIVQLGVGLLIFFFAPEEKEFAMGIISTALTGFTIGLGHKAKKGLEG